MGCGASKKAIFDKSNPAVAAAGQEDRQQDEVQVCFINTYLPAQRRGHGPKDSLLTTCQAGAEWQVVRSESCNGPKNIKQQGSRD
jgi:hypothetical protein